MPLVRYFISFAGGEWQEIDVDEYRYWLGMAVPLEGIRLAAVES